MFKKCFLLGCILCGYYSFVFSQGVDTLYFDKSWNKTTKSNKFYSRIIKTYNNKTFLVYDYYPSGKKLMEGSLLQVNPDVRDGIFVWWYENGRVQKEVTFKIDEIVRMEEFDEMGRQLEHTTLFNTHQKDDDGGEYISVRPIDQRPIFPGGRIGLSDYIRAKLDYPEEAIEDKIGGNVVVKFSIGIDGKVGSIEVVKGVHRSLDEQAVRMVKKMPKWKPAMDAGQPIEIFYKLTIKFDLAEEIKRLSLKKDYQDQKRITLKGYDY